MSSEYEVPQVEWSHQKAVKFYKNYMRQFWGKHVKPFDQKRRDRLNEIFNKSFEDKQYTVGLLVKDRADFLRVGSVHLMAIHKRVFWDYFDINVLLNQYMANEWPLEVEEYEYAILSFHGGANRYLPKFADMIITQREIKRQFTLVMSIADTEWLGTSLFDPFVELDGAYRWPYTGLDKSGVAIKSRDAPIKIPEGQRSHSVDLPEFKDLAYKDK